MNNSIAVFLINKNVRAVVGIYEVDIPNGKQASRTMFKTFDQSIQVGDYVVVPSCTRHGLTTNKIVEVDADPDFDSNVEMRWVICRIDKVEYEATLRMENEAIAKIRSAEKRKKQDELRAALLIDNEALRGLSLSMAGEELPPPMQPPPREDA